MGRAAISKVIEVPPITPKGSVLLTDKEMRDIQIDFENLKTAAGTMANIAICLLKMLDTEGKEEIVVDRELIERTKGAQLVLREDNGNVIAKVISRSPRLINIEGRNE